MDDQGGETQEGDPVRDGTVAVTIRNSRGLHARAAAKFVKLAASFDASVTVSKDDMAVGGESIMGLMMLGAGKGCSVTLSAEGPQAETALSALTALVASGFGEDD